MTIPPTPNQLPANPQSSAEQIPASVRSAPVLGGHDISTSTPTAAQSNSAKSWRFDVATPEDFQKYVQMSTQGAVIFGLYAPHSPASLEMLDAVENLVNAAEGAMLLAAVDITKLPEAAQAFGMDGVPAGVAVIAGRPAPLYNGQISPQDLSEMLKQVLQVAEQYQLPGGFEPAPSDEEEKTLPPLHAKALEALDERDYEGARAAYREALTENPGDHDAKVGLAQVDLLARVADLDLAQEREAAASDALNIEAAFNVADLDVTGGHVEDAYARLLRLFKSVSPEDKSRVRERLVQLFDVVGATDPRTVKARAELTMAIF